MKYKSPGETVILLLSCGLLLAISSAQIPKFSPARATLNFSEGAIIGTQRLIDTADVEQGYTIRSYKILDDVTGSFRLHETRSAQQINYLHLETTKRLDREETSQFRLNISATSDIGETGYLDLTVNVLDINDNPPIFEKNEYVVSINESIAIGSPLIRIRANDADAEKNGLVSYHLSREFSSHFSMDRDTGLMQVRSSLQCQKCGLPCLETKVCNVLIFARDSGQPQQSSQTVVKVRLVHQANDHTPEISFRYLPDQFRSYASVEERAKVNTSVAAITVTDQDQGRHGQTSVKIISGNEDGFFILEAYGGSLYVVRVSPIARFEKNRQRTYNLTVKAEDNGTPPKSSVKHLIVKVNEINDYEPIFESLKYEAVINEDAALGSSVIIVSATDQDSKTIFYSLRPSSDYDDWFFIHPTSGLVTTREKLDRETISKVKLNVSARDGNIQYKETFTTVLVEIRDVNDNIPTFEKSEFFFNVSEDTGPDVVFAKLIAKDLDLGPNGTVSYSLDSSWFKIDSQTGQISTVKSLDRESINKHVFKVTAQDSGTKLSLSSTATLTVHVTDVNDNSPIFYPIMYVVVMNEEGDPLYVRAEDKDAERNADITYDWVGNPPHGLNLDKSTGMLTKSSSLSTDSIYTSLTYQISATDGGGRRSPQNAQVLIKPRYVNPLKLIKSAKYEFTIVEDSELNNSHKGGITVGEILLQPGLQADVDFRIINGDENSAFNIDSNSGMITTKSRIDREIKAFYNLRVLVQTKKPEEEFFAIVEVDITVKDVNDNAPKIDCNLNVVKIERNAAIGQYVYKVKAVDRDDAENGKLNFRIVNTNPRTWEYFLLDPHSGILQLNKSLVEAGTRKFDMEIQVYDSGTPRMSSDLKLQIIVIDTNDHAPIFDFDHYEISVSETTAVNSRILLLTALDIDSQDSMTYSIVDGDSHKFGIFPNGELYLQESLDREDVAYYAVTVEVNDHGHPKSRSSTTTIVIYVTDENDNPPIFQKRNYVFYLHENENRNTVVGRVTATDQDIDRNAELTYSFVSASKYFRIESSSGFIISDFTIDRESLIHETGQDFFQFDVQVQDNGVTRAADYASVNVVIIDRNDNSPIFSQRSYEASISESAKIGTEVVSIHAEDIDKDDNGRVLYSLLEKDDFFEVNPDSGVVTLISDKLDREMKATHEMRIMAIDHGSPPMSSTAKIIISVLDENDNKPKFAKSQMTLPLSESTKVGERVYKFEATDSDSGANGRVKYSLGGGADRNFFHLDTYTGCLTLSGQLDHESKKEFELVVSAVDGGTPSLTGTLSLTVKVLDENDNAPSFPSTVLLIPVKEGISIGSSIFKMEAVDRDSGTNGQFKFGIKDSNEFRIDTYTGVITTSAEIDRETKDNYEVIVTATDLGTPPMTSEKKITIKVDDINDVTPNIRSLNTALVLPGTPKGNVILQVKAEDNDAASNGLVVYELTENDDTYELERHSGKLILKRDVHNQEPLKTLTIIARDEAVRSARRSSTGMITVIIGRDTPGPSFTRETYTASVKENSPKGTPVGTVSLVSDDGQNVNFYVVESISQSGKERDLFIVDKKSGQVRTSRVLDRETEGNKITLSIVALVGDNAMSGCKMEITLMDENDSPPTFDDALTVMISEGFLSGHDLGYVRALDLDENSVLTYSLGLFTQSFLSIDNTTGRLTLLQSVDREAYSSLEVVIVVSDQEHTTEWKKEIKIQDVNDNPPKFSLSHFSFDVLESSERGAVIGRIEADDLDEGVNGDITYALISEWGSSTFSLDPTSGVLTLSGSLDHEEIEHYILEVSASDGGDPTLTTTVTVYINVKDVNDNAPEIERVLYEVSVDEDAPIGHSIVQIIVTDKDSAENTQIVFTLDESVQETFDITSNGTITTKVNLDRETIPFYTFTVHVRDSESERFQQTATAVVQISINDINDDAPSFVDLSESAQNISASVSENLPPNSPIVTLRTFDGDEGKNAEISYFLDDSQLGKFSIGRIDGVLRTGEALDRETKDKYLLTVSAVDNGSPQLSSRVDVVVTVEDMNDNAPKFNPKHYSASVLENASVGMDVLQSTAFDNDLGENGRLRYSIISGDSTGDFSIGEYSGILKINKKLDYERKNNYDLTIQAEDGGGDTAKYDTASITIIILDTNDNAPIFVHSPYIAKIKENFDLHEPFYKLKAKDKDDPPYNSIEYALHNTLDDLFTVDSDTGDVFVNRPVDRETCDSVISLELLATDSGTPRLTSTGTLTVIIEDENDNPPHFENNIYHYYVEENQPVGTSVATLKAFDEDEGVNAELRYSLKDFSKTFDVDEITGIIRTKTILDRESNSEYAFQILATDQSPYNPLTGSSNITVYVTDVNDNKPVILLNSTDFFISPQLKPGDFVFGVFATDADYGDNGKLRYRMTGKDSRNFEINRNNGVVTASRTFSKKFSYDLNVIVSDSGTSKRLTAQQEIAVYLAEDLSVPTFQDGPTEILVDEDLKPKEVVLVVNADASEGEKERVRYGIAGGNINSAFAVVFETGEIQIGTGLDFETTKVYELWIKAFYETKPLFFNAVMVRIKVIDKNDNAPQFRNLLNKIEVPEGLYPPFDLLELSSTDLDTGENGRVSYEILETAFPFFEVDENSGLITCHHELDREERDHYTLKVLAKDHGYPSLSSTATILLTVQDVNDNAPKFSRIYSVNITENVRPGTKILTVETVDRDTAINANVSYSFKSNPDNAFRIDALRGDIYVIGNIDREIRDEFAVKVEATDGAWKLETVVTITVQDENDNVPIFDQDLYNFMHPYSKQNESDQLIGKVHALDRDSSGPNSAVSYSLAHVSDFFVIDSSSGRISTKKILDYKGSNDGYAADNSYRIRVLATDGGSPPMSSECQVVITLVDGNHNKPEFKGKTIQEVAVPVGIPAGTLIYTLEATDRDPLTTLHYEILSGNGSLSFELDSLSGEIRASKTKNHRIGTRYKVKFVVSDAGIPELKDYKTMYFVITDDNKFSPEFQVPTTRIYIREDENVGNTIITLTATDQDEGVNGYVEYRIVKGDPEGMFDIGSTDGKVIVKRALDYEKIPIYNIIVEAKDKGFYPRSSTSSVKIILQDVDDNKLFFDQQYYEASIKENSQPGSVITQITATDQDSPKFAQIEYSIAENQNLFAIDPHSGIITSKVEFDYEQIPFVDLKILANSSNYVANTRLRINIQGENEFYPKFKQPVFQFAVSETSRLGSSIGQVEADDYDSGTDGEIFYFFVGASNSAGFDIGRSSGIISVQKTLDRESQNRYVLTVLAKNRGSILGNDIDEAQVIIQVQDGNDPPVFRKQLYTTEVSEDAIPGTDVITVVAVDGDVRPRNSHFSYSLEDSSVFSIGDNSGSIVVSGPLDRESISVYNLTVRAIDNGSPPATGTTVVRVFINDINDSPPKLDTVKGRVKENNPPDSFVIKLSASDPDLPPNAGPFRFSLEPNEYLRLDRDIIRTKSMIDREEIPFIKAVVGVEDSGRPSLTASYDLEIEVGDENDNPSSPRTMNVIIKNYEGTFLGGLITKVRPSDPDLRGQYHCQLLRGPETIFRLEPNCGVFAGRIQNGREYELEVRANDGKHSDVNVKVRLNFASFNKFAVSESVALKFRNVTPDRVLGFFERLKSPRSDQVLELLSLTASNDDESVESYAILKQNDIYLQKTDTLNFLREQSASFSEANFVVNMDYNPCTGNPCLHSGKCNSVKRVGNSTEIIEFGDSIINSPVFVQEITCRCSNEYSGNRCQIQKNPCNPSPCLGGGRCIIVQEVSSFQCLCPPLRGGKQCEKAKTDVCQPNPCLNGGSCQGSRDSFFCLCRSGYHGDRCERAIDSCRRNPCLNGGICISQKPDYRCQCPDNFYGNRCELSTFGFDELSFMTFPALDANINDISVTFATTKPNCLLIYNNGEVAAGRSDFLAVELVNGRPRFSWGGARTAVTILELPRKVNTGRWYKVTATRNNRVASLSVEDCTESAEYCKLCQQDDSRCFTKDLGEAGTLVFGNNPMYLGGLESEVSFLERPGQLNTDDFVGCIKSLTVNGNEKNFKKDSLNQTGIKSTCNFVSPCNRGDECGGDLVGTCLPLWSRHQCSCGPNSILAKDCDESFAPITLTEEKQVDFVPTRKFKRLMSLDLLYSGFHQWNNHDNNEDYNQSRQTFSSSVSLTFRTLQDNSIILTSMGPTGSTKIVLISGILMYQSSGIGLPDINMTSGVYVNDGSWHSFTIRSTGKNSINLILDGEKVGYDIEFESAHKFLDVKTLTVGLKDSEKGFRGCLTNFTINEELQSVFGSESHPLLKPIVPLLINSVGGCDLEVLQSTRASSTIDIGVALVIAFFVVLFTCFGCSCLMFRVRKWLAKKSVFVQKAATSSSTYNNRGAELNESLPQQLQRGSGVGGNEQNGGNNTSMMMMLKVPGNKPDIIDSDHDILLHHPRHMHDTDTGYYDRAATAAVAAEHYDLDNASSIAPSDIDVAYHYKAYRRSGVNQGTKLPPPPSKKKRPPPPHIQNTPLARLSPSSEISHNTPRILTLGDLSGKPLPPGLDRGLNSPISQMSRSSGDSRRKQLPQQQQQQVQQQQSQQRGLTSENVARFNTKNSTLVNTLDLVGSEDRKMMTQKKKKKKNSVPSGRSRRASSSSSNRSDDVDDDDDDDDDDDRDDSFTCSEYDYDEVVGSAGNGRNSINNTLKESGRASTGNSAMVFSKLMDMEPENNSYFRDALEDDEDDEDEEGGGDVENVDRNDLLNRPRPTSAGVRSWEHLLSWCPDYESFAGVFRDIAELPHNNCAISDFHRPNPLGERAGNEEEYI